MRSTLFAALLVATIPTFAAAQGGSWHVSLGGGATIPLGTSADLYQTGYHGMVAFSYRPSDSKLAYGLITSLHRLNQDAFPGEHANIFAAFARADYDVSPMLYAIGGLGIVRNENQLIISGTQITNTNNDFAMTAGMGIRFGGKFFAEGRVMYGFGSPKSTLIPLTVGFTF